MLGIKPSTLEFDEYIDDDINHYYLEKAINSVDIKCYHENKTNMSIINNDTINKITSLTYFYTNGNLSSISSEINNKSTGKYAKYYEDGKLAEEGKYKITKDSSSQKDSIWNYYYKEGLLRASIFYNEGKIKGSSKYYDKIGKLRRIEIIENDGKHYNIFDGDTVNYTDKNGLKQGKWIGFPYSFMSEKEFCDDMFQAKLNILKTVIQSEYGKIIGQKDFMMWEKRNISGKIQPLLIAMFIIKKTKYKKKAK